jgi:rSAM/selenodomain-associated transferase 2
MIWVIIPAYNEERALPETLRQLFRQPGRYEVLVVDGGSTDRTKRVCEEFGFLADPSSLTHYPARLFLTAPKGRALQMNAGAREAAARGAAPDDWFLFLHADTMLPDGALRRLNDMESDATVQTGGFLHRFSGTDWRLRVISVLDNFRCRHSRIIYGDQAMFVRRSLFEQLGGFPDRPILEDVAFCEKLIRVARPLLLTPPVLTDSRKFVKMGVWRSFARVLLIILHVEFHLPVLPRAFFQDIR